jgi:D-arabinose 1-dehydrogenase-like Zn-dependent alcohol dehydrogenase
VAEGKVRPVVTQRCSLDGADAVLRAIERMEVAGRACVVFA